MATFDNLWETFPDENCVLTNRELLLEVRRNRLLHKKQAFTFMSVFTVLSYATKLAMPWQQFVHNYSNISCKPISKLK